MPGNKGIEKGIKVIKDVPVITALLYLFLLHVIIGGAQAQAGI